MSDTNFHKYNAVYNLRVSGEYKRTPMAAWLESETETAQIQRSAAIAKIETLRLVGYRLQKELFDKASKEPILCANYERTQICDDCRGRKFEEHKCRDWQPVYDTKEKSNE